MDTRETALQVARIPVLLLLVMWVAPGIVDNFERASDFARWQDVWVSWVMLSFLSLAFVLIVLMGRHRWHPWAVLGMEVVVTAVLAFVPPFQWALWLGVSAGATTFVSGFVQPLAMAWLGVVLVRTFHQARGGMPAASHRRNGDGATGRAADATGPIRTT